MTNGIRHPRSRETSFYHVDDCHMCYYKTYCMKTLKDHSKNDRYFETNRDLYRDRMNANHNLLSPKGIELRINRSSQVEGAFGVIKQDMDYDRIRRRGLENVGSEIMLVTMGYNIRKLLSLLDGNSLPSYWIAPKSLEPEIPRKFNIDKFIKNQKKYWRYFTPIILHFLFGVLQQSE